MYGLANGFLVCGFFFFKQKTAYEMRISDWSSDVCSSDLNLPLHRTTPEHGHDTNRMPNHDIPADIIDRAAKIRLACFDVDGTMTNGRLWFDAAGREDKAFRGVAGQGLARRRRPGLERRRGVWDERGNVNVSHGACR